jgi:hypothetical protein
MATKDGKNKDCQLLTDNWDNALSTGDMTDKELSSLTTTTKQMDNDLTSLKQSKDNHMKLIEAAARFEMQERKETADKDCQFKIHAKAYMAILCLEVDEQVLMIRKAIAYQENDQVLVYIYNMQIATVSAQIEFHQAIQAAEHERNETPKKGNKTRNKTYTDELDGSN